MKPPPADAYSSRRRACEISRHRFLRTPPLPCRDSATPALIAARLLVKSGMKVIAGQRLARRHPESQRAGCHCGDRAQRERLAPWLDSPARKPISSEAVLEPRSGCAGAGRAGKSDHAARMRTRSAPKSLAEAANGPTTPARRRYPLQEGDRSVTGHPGQPPGGVTVSYFEWVQDSWRKDFWEENEVNRRLEKVMGKAFDDVHSTAKKYSVDMRTGAYILAIGRVAKATEVARHLAVSRVG